MRRRQCYLGVCYFQNGQGVKQGITPTAVRSGSANRRWIKTTPSPNVILASATGWARACLPQEFGRGRQMAARGGPEQGDPAAQFNLGTLYRNRPGRLAKLRKRGGEMVSRIGGTRLSGGANFNLGVFYAERAGGGAGFCRGRQIGISPPCRTGTGTGAMQSRPLLSGRASGVEQSKSGSGPLVHPRRMPPGGRQDRPAQSRPALRRGGMRRWQSTARPPVEKPSRNTPALKFSVSPVPASFAKLSPAGINRFQPASSQPSGQRFTLPGHDEQGRAGIQQDATSRFRPRSRSLRKMFRVISAF